MPLTGTTAIETNGYRVSMPDCRRSSVSSTAPAVVLRCTSAAVVWARNCAWSVSERMRDFTR